MLCKLSELAEIRPSKVLQMVPGASAAQIGAFLELAEEKIRRQEMVQSKSAEVLEKDAIPDEQDAISLLGSLKELRAGDPESTPKLSCPTDEKSEFMQHLKKIIPPDDGGNDGESINFTKQFQVKILNLLEAAKPSKDFDDKHFEQVYEKLLKDPLARAQLENLHAARSHKYGYAHFGSKFWDKESKNVARKFKSQTDRRKLRIGLKGLIDFINQLNIKDLEKLLKKGEAEGFKLLKMPTPVSPATFCKYLEHVPPLKLIEFFNSAKAAEIRKVIEKISSMAHFSQSMADYYARDDALEPALAVVCEVLRNTEDIGGVLKNRAATFLSLAQPYEKERSEVDHDVKREKKSQNRRSKLCCFRFQEGRCTVRDCAFSHKCNYCGSLRHGEVDCSQKRRRTRKQKKSKN